ncbi:cytochrome c oxidase subunit II [Saccharicrinis aurantiacus]|uniref:cytochrome c oxidase subunit II n=1 Tax=Saccharicrinis aurantiacus TaxID=1849719 RepID=UPI00094FEC3C|nr:cytochrome c oxidase subunit II [Saccharicrinis aurantiacus]
MIEETTNNASNFVSEVDSAFVFIFGISLFFLFAITIVMVYYVFRYRKSKNPKATHIEGNHKLEIIWTVIPTILVVIMFYYGWAGWKSQREVPEDAMTIKSIARMWSFGFEYENGVTTDTLYVPIHQPINLDLVAVDVLHSIYIPAFRIKQDMVPGKPDFIWFESGKIGEYEIFCAEYCGLRHSFMKTAVKVLSQEDYDAWYKGSSQTAEGAGAEGKALFQKFGCFACHSIDGSKLVGPSLKGIFNNKRMVIKDGEEIELVADAEYIKRSIYEPNADVVKDFVPGMMVSYKAMIKDEEVDQLIEYFKTLE